MVLKRILVGALVLILTAVAIEVVLLYTRRAQLEGMIAHDLMAGHQRGETARSIEDSVFESLAMSPVGDLSERAGVELVGAGEDDDMYATVTYPDALTILFVDVPIEMRIEAMSAWSDNCPECGGMMTDRTRRIRPE